MNAQVVALGNLGSDAHVHTFNKGRHVISFSLATHNYYVDAAGKRVASTQWYACKRFISKDPEKLMGILTKGTKVLVTGSLLAEIWESPSKVKHQSYYIDVARIELH